MKFKFGDKVTYKDISVSVELDLVLTHVGQDGKTFIGRINGDDARVGWTKYLKRGWKKRRRK